MVPRILLGCAVVLVLVIASYFLVPHLSYFKGDRALTAYADEVIRTCATAPYIPSCYDNEIPRLMDRGLSMEEAFAVTAIVQSKTNGYFYCHVLGHKIAEHETAKDPSQWTSVIGRCPSGMCSNGCLHGAAQERFRAESLTPTQVDEIIPQLKSICTTARSYTGLEQASCSHSMGHLAMYLTSGKIDAATGVCDRVAKDETRDHTQLCYEGAYMQIFQPLEPEDFGLVRNIAPTTTTRAQSFCNTFSGERRAACHRESWPLYRSEIQAAEGLQSFCSLVPGAAHQNRCYTAMFYVIAAQLGLKEDRVIAFCSGLSDPQRAQCFANTASRFIETDYRLAPSAAAICKEAEVQGAGERCYTELLFYSQYNFHADSKEFTQLCSALPEPWNARCIQGEGARARSPEVYTAD